MPAFDVRTKKGKRIQVKALRLMAKTRKNLSAIRDDEFDSIFAVIFEEDMRVREGLLISFSAYERHRHWSKTWKAYGLRISRALLNDPEVEHIRAEQLL